MKKKCIPFVNLFIEIPKYRKYLRFATLSKIYDIRVIKNDEKQMDFYYNRLNIKATNSTHHKLIVYYCKENKLNLLKWLWNNCEKHLKYWTGIKKMNLLHYRPQLDPFVKVCREGNVEAVKLVWEKIKSYMTPQDAINYIFEADKAPKNDREIMQFLWPHTKGKMELSHTSYSKFIDMSEENQEWLKKKIESQYTFLRLAKWLNLRSTSDYYPLR